MRPIRDALARGTFGQYALQGPTVHIEPSRRFRNVAIAGLIYTLDVLPAHAIG